MEMYEQLPPDFSTHPMLFNETILRHNILRDQPAWFRQVWSKRRILGNETLSLSLKA